MTKHMELVPLYANARRALAEARRVDEVKNIRDKMVALRAYAQQAKDREMEADAIEIRMRATRRLDELRRAQKATVGLTKGGGGKHGRKRVAEKPTLKDAGIDKNLAHEGRKLCALSEQEFEQKVTEARYAVTSVVAKVVKSITLPENEIADQVSEALSNDYVILKTHLGEEVRYQLPEGKATFIRQTNQQIDWAAWSWNPVTGCLHGCKYCYARDRAIRHKGIYPIGFDPLFHHERLDAPANTKVPEDASTDARLKRVWCRS